MELRILFTGIGRRVELVQAFVELPVDIDSATALVCPHKAAALVDSSNSSA